MIMDLNPYSRRKLLNAIGSGGIVSLGTSSRASAETFDEWCEDYVRELMDEGMTSTEARQYFYDTYGHECGDTGIRSTSSSGFPINACANVSVLDREYCFDAPGYEEDVGRWCNGTFVYPDISWGMDLDAYTLYDGDRGEIEWSFSGWFGISEASDGRLCFYVGEESSGWCMEVCQPEPSSSPVPHDYADVARDLLEEVESRDDAIRFGVGAIKVIALLLALILYIAKCTITLGYGCAGA